MGRGHGTVRICDETVDSCGLKVAVCADVVRRREEALRHTENPDSKIRVTGLKHFVHKIQIEMKWQI